MTSKQHVLTVKPRRNIVSGKFTIPDALWDPTGLVYLDLMNLSLNSTNRAPVVKTKIEKIHVFAQNILGIFLFGTWEFFLMYRIT